MNAHKGPVERTVPAIVEPKLQQKALARLEENKRYAGGKKYRRKYLLRGLVSCAYCGTACTGDNSVSSTGYRYHYYSCHKKRMTYDKRFRGLSCPEVKARWLEELVWADVKSFLENPGEVLERVREQPAEDGEGNDLEERHASLTRRLAAKQEEKGRYVKLYAQGHVDEEELEVHIADVKNQVENLKMLLASVESDLAPEEGFETRRELVKLLVEKIAVSRVEDGRAKVEITYRFGPPPGGANSADGVRNSEEFKKAHAQGGGELLRGHPRMSTYEVALEREPTGTSGG